jgi:hypothetical protein
VTTRVEEPTTVATDWLMAALAAYWAVSLVAAGAGRADGLATRVWGVAFAATAVAALLGGAVHGFASRMGDTRTRRLWLATLSMVAFGSAAMVAGVILVYPTTPLRTVGLALVALKLVAALILIARTPSFGIALVDHSLALAAVLALQAGAWAMYQAASAPWIAAGVAVSAAAGAIQAAWIAPHPRFNHNDLYHLVQIGALWLLYRGGLLLVAAW